MIEAVGRYAAEREIIVINDRMNDIAAALRTLMNIILDCQVCDHGIAFGGTAPLSIKDAAQRRPRTAERGVADGVWNDRDAAAQQDIECPFGIAAHVEDGHWRYSTVRKDSSQFRYSSRSTTT